MRDALFSVTGRLRNNLFYSKMSNDHGARGTHPRGNGRHYNEHSNLNQSMDSLKLSSNTDHLPTPAQRQSQIVAGNPMAGQNVGKGSTSVKGGIELGRGGRSAIVKNMSVEIVVPQNVIGSVYGENGTNLARLRQLWNPKEVTTQEYNEFYRKAFNEYLDPLASSNFTTEVNARYM